jgi:pyrimidine operon attenuation protein/uracil phosphoribosyltransferase
LKSQSGQRQSKKTSREKKGMDIKQAQKMDSTLKGIAQVKLMLADRLKQTIKDIEEMTVEEFETWAVYISMIDAKD